MQRLMSRVVLGCAVLALSGCASVYLDSATREIPSSSFKKPTAPKPVQFLFEFQTKGVPNPSATKVLNPIVKDQIKASGLFSDVQDTPVADGALLSITLNNVPLTDDAFNKGFVTGLTFGLAGSQVSDGYVCTAKFVPSAQAAPINAAARHAIHTVLGAKEAPANATKYDSLDAAALAMTRQVVSNVLHDLSRDPGFK